MDDAQRPATAPAPERVAVIGGGTMGSGIAQVVAQAGLRVVLIERTDDDAQRARAKIEQNLRRLVDRGKLERERVAEIVGRVEFEASMEAAAGADFAIEAVFEDPALKLDVCRAVTAALGDDVVYASNTSSISITAIASAARRPEAVCGMHFFNPVPVMALVEVVRAERSAPETVRRTVELARRLGKSPVEVNDLPGFVANRVLMPMINEAVFCLAEGVATKEAIDDVMKLGMAHPMGPLALADLIGIDVCLAILEVLHRDLGDDKYRPAPLLRRMAAAGKLGRKNGEGFYVY